MIAMRSNASGPIQCPADGCPDTYLDHRRFGEHIKNSHTLPAAVVLVPETPPATLPASRQRPHPYLPPSSVASAHPTPTSGTRSSSPSLAFPSSSDEAVARPPNSPDPGEPPFASLSQHSGHCKVLAHCSSLLLGPALPSADIPAAPDHLDGSKSYLETSDVLRAMGLFYHTHFKVFLCTCGKAVLPNACVTHAGGHDIKVTGAVQAAFQNLAGGLGIATTLTAPPCPPPRGPPVELLTLWKGGFCCNFCTYCARVKKSLSNHWYQSHHDRPEVSPERRFHRAAVQTFYAPAGERYFEVNPDLAGLSPDDVFMLYMRDDVPKFAAFPATVPEDEREVPPLLQVTQWHVHLSAYSADPQRREALRSLVKLPASNAPAGLGRLGTIVLKYLREIRSLAKNSDFGVLTLLMECPR